MSIRSVAIVLVLFIAAAWWLLRADPEAEVRNAHRELAELLNKPEGDPDPLSILEIRALQHLFAETCVVTGAARGLLGQYSPEQMVGTIVRVHELFDSIDLRFSEPSISFPADDEAVAVFSAELSAASGRDAVEDVIEARAVTTRMHEIDGSWAFYEINLAERP